MEFSFAFRMDFHLSPRNFYLKSFPSCTNGIPAQQRHFVVHVQCNNQSTKPMTEAEVTWGRFVCWHHGRPLGPVELCTDRSCFVKIGVLAHTRACAVLVGPALLQAVSRSRVCRSSAQHWLYGILDCTVSYTPPRLGPSGGATVRKAAFCLLGVLGTKKRTSSGAGVCTKGWGACLDVCQPCPVSDVSTQEKWAQK